MKKKASTMLLLFLVTVLLTSISPYVVQTSTPLSSMVSYWRFDEGTGTVASDSAGSNPGSLQLGPTWVTGKVDDALSFDGDNDYVRVWDAPSLDFGPGQDFSLEAWIKAKPDQAFWQGTILAKFNPASGAVTKRSYGYSLMVRGTQDTTNEGRIGVWLGDGYGADGPSQLYTANTYDDDNWHHVVATIDRDGLATLYIDGGIEVVSADISSLAAIDESTAENLEIGREGVFDQYWFNGVIDEVAIYDRVVSEGEIHQHYLNGLNGYGYDFVIPTTIDIDPNLLNLKSNGEWITTYITLPAGYSVEDVDVETVELNHNDFTLTASWVDIQDGVLMVKFDRTTLITHLDAPDVTEFDSGKFCDVLLTISGNLLNGLAFEGSDTICVKRR